MPEVTGWNAWTQGFNLRFCRITRVSRPRRHDGHGRKTQADQLTSSAFRLIVVPERALLTGQLALAVSAAFWKSSADRPGT